METPAKRREQASATNAPTLWATFGCFAFLALTLHAQPSWWSTVLNGNASIDYMVANQGQLKQFTARAVAEMNLTLTNSGGAGPDLSNLVYGWQQDYLTNGYATNAANPYRPYKPSDYNAINVGQLKYVGKLIWSRLIAAGYTEYPPSWLGSSNSADLQVANLGQLKTVFAFDPTVPPSAVTGLTATPIPMGIQLTWTDPTNNPITTITLIQTNPDGSTTTYTLDGSSTSFSPPNLIPGQTYAFQLISSNNVSTSGTSSIASSTSQAAPPIPPTPEELFGNFTTSNTAIELSWPDSAGAIIYAIDRETIANGVWAYNYASATALSFTDTNYDALGGYRYQIRASADGIYFSSPSGPFPQPKYAIIDLGTNQSPIFMNNIGSVVLRGATGYTFWKNGQTSSIPLDYIAGLNDSDSMVGSWSTNSDHIPVNTDQSNTVIYTSCAVEANGANTQIAHNFDSAFPTRNINITFGPWTYDSSVPSGIDNSGNVFANATKAYGYWPYNDQGILFVQTAGDVIAVKGNIPMGIAGPASMSAPNNLTQDGIEQGTNFFIQTVGSSGVALGTYYAYTNYLSSPSQLASSAPAYWNDTINTLTTNSTLFSVNSAGEILGTTGGSVVVFNSSLANSQYPPFAGVWNVHHEVVAASSVVPAGTSPYGSSFYCDGITTNIYNLNDLIPDGSGWTSINTPQINDSGAIVGTATYTQSGNNTNIANGQHGVLLAPAYEIQVDGFIPQEYVGDPYPFTGLYFAGDMRKTPLDGSFTSGYAIFNKYLGYTARQKVMATVYAELDPSGSQEQEESNNNPTSIIHLTKEYNSSQFTTTPAGVSPSNGTAHILPGAVPINTETAIPQTATVTVTHPSSRVVQAEFKCAVSDPLVWGSTVAPLYYDITVKIDASNPAQPTYTLSGNHKLFPAYEIYINHQLVHDYSPISGIGYSPAELAYPDSTAPSLSDSLITSQCATMPGLTGNITNQP